jgi:hypothetical protein
MSNIFTTWPGLIIHLSVVIYLSLFIWALVYVFSFGLSGLRVAIWEFSSFSVRGFSARRTAYLLVIVDAALIPFHWGANWAHDSAIMLGALLLSLAILALSFFISKAARGRFLPFAFSIILFLYHSLLCKA